MADTSISDPRASTGAISPPQHAVLDYGVAAAFFALGFYARSRTGDIAQAALAGLGPMLFGFANDPEAKYFYGQAVTEIGVIGTTDWDAAGSHP